MTTSWLMSASEILEKRLVHGMCSEFARIARSPSGHQTLRGIVIGRMFCLIVLLVMVCACGVWSIHPIDPDAAGSVDSAPFLGDWEVVTFMDQAPMQPLAIRVERGAQGELLLSTQNAPNSSTGTAFLATIDNQLVLSVRNQDQPWYLFALDLENEDQRLIVRGLSILTINQALAAGTLSAAPAEMQIEGDEVEIRAEPNELVSYFSENLDAFDLQVATLQKLSP